MLECKTVELTSDDDWEPSETHLDEYIEDDYLRLEHPNAADLSNCGNAKYNDLLK